MNFIYSQNAIGKVQKYSYANIRKTERLGKISKESQNDGPLNQLTHEEQQQIIRPLLDKDVDKQMEFNIVIEEVLKGAVPEKVLKNYVGTYELEFKGTILEKLQSYIGGPYDEIPLKIENEGT